MLAKIRVALNVRMVVWVAKTRVRVAVIKLVRRVQVRVVQPVQVHVVAHAQARVPVVVLVVLVVPDVAANAQMLVRLLLKWKL